MEYSGRNVRFPPHRSQGRGEGERSLFPPGTRILPSNPHQRRPNHPRRIPDLMLHYRRFQRVIKHKLRHLRHPQRVYRVKLRNPAPQHHHIRVQHINQIRHRPPEIPEKHPHERHRPRRPLMILLLNLKKRPLHPELLEILLLQPPAADERLHAPLLTARRNPSP